MKLLDLNEKSECNCTLGSSSSYLVNRVNDPALFKQELFLKIFEDSENIDSFTNYSLTSDLLKFKYFSHYLSTSLRVPTRDINLGYVRGEEPPSPRKMLLNFGKRITNGTQHNVKAKLVRQGNIKMTIDRVLTLFSLEELFQAEDNPEDAIYRFKEYVRESIESQVEQHSFRGSSTRRSASTRKSKHKEYSISNKSATKIEMLHELNDNYIILPRKAIISRSVSDYRLNCFGFSENGEFDKIYIPFLKQNEHIEAICLDSDRLNPQHNYIQQAFRNKKKIKKLHYKGTLEQSQEQERTFESLEKLVVSWGDLETFAIVKTSLSLNCLKSFRNIVTHHFRLQHLFIQTCEIQTDLFTSNSFLFDILRETPILEVLGLDLSFTGVLNFEEPRKPFYLRRLREFSCKLKSQRDRGLDALKIVITIVKESDCLEIFSSQVPSQSSFLIDNEDSEIVASLCDIISKNKKLRCFFLDIDITDDVSIKFAHAGLLAIKNNPDFKYFCSINCNNIRRFYKAVNPSNRSQRGLLNERGTILSLYEHLDLSNGQNQKDFPYRFIIPFLSLIAMDLRSFTQIFPVHKSLVLDFKELKNQMAQSNLGSILVYRRKARNCKQPLPLFLGVVVPKLQPSILKLEGIQSGLGRLSFAILKYFSVSMGSLREISFQGSRFDSFCTIPGQLLTRMPRLETINFRGTNFLKTQVDEFLVALQESKNLKSLDLGDLMSYEQSQYRKLMSSLGQNKSIRTLTLPSARQLQEWYGSNTSTQRLILTIKEDEFIKEIFHSSASLLESWNFLHGLGRPSRRNLTSRAALPDLQSLVREERLPSFFNQVRGVNLQTQEQSHLSILGSPLFQSLRRDRSQGRRGSIENPGEPQILEQEKKEPPQPQRRENICRNFLHKVAREGRLRQLRSITLMQEDESRVLSDIKKILGNVSHEADVSSSKEGRNKNLVFKPQYYLLRRKDEKQMTKVNEADNIIPVSEHLVEFLLRCYLALEDNNWQVSRFGFEKFEFQDQKELLYDFLATFGEKKSITQLVLDSCKLDSITDFSFLKRATSRAQKLNLRNNQLTADQMASVITEVGENPALKHIILGNNKKKVVTSEVVQDALVKSKRVFTVNKKHEILFE